MQCVRVLVRRRLDEEAVVHDDKKRLLAEQEASSTEDILLPHASLPEAVKRISDTLGEAAVVGH